MPPQFEGLDFKSFHRGTGSTIVPFSLKSTDGFAEKVQSPVRPAGGVNGTPGSPLELQYFSDLSAVNIYKVPSKLI